MPANDRERTEPAQFPRVPWPNASGPSGQETGASIVSLVLITVLGPIAATLSDGARFEPPSESQRKLLALLAIRAGRAVASDTICDLFELTPGAVRTTVSRLRKALGEVVVTEVQGYALHAETDVQLFQRLVSTAKTASSSEAAALRTQALELFGGPALDEFSDEPWAVAEVTRLTELRSAVVEDLVEGYIADGEHDVAIDHLHRHLLENPYRDRPHELLMQALALSGRQVEALRSFQDYRNRLIDEVGVEPAAAISEMDRLISMGELNAADHGSADTTTRVLAPVAPNAAVSNLHFPPNEFVGRQEEIAEVGHALAQSRLVTLSGPGGVGKTRLAYRVAAEQIDTFSDGAWVAELVSCEDANDIIRTIADVFGLSDVDSPEHCAAQLSGHDLLLVLDNCEHLTSELATILEMLLSRTARLRILATSRVRLGVVGEQSVTIAPLRTTEAQDLFMRRAAAAGAEFSDADTEAIRDICQRLDGIPLALELAAATSRMMSPIELLERLEDRFEILKGGPRGSVAGRHESLRAAVDSSYETLDQATQTFFRRVSVFAGDFPLSGAEAMADDLAGGAFDLIAELVDRSLLTVQTESGRSRYRLLETLRQYGVDRLEELGEKPDAIERHVTWCFDYVEQLARKAFGSSEAASLHELVASAANFRLALGRLVEGGDLLRAGDLVLRFEDFAYASHTLAGLVAPMIEAGVAEAHPERRRLLAIELIRRGTTTGNTTTRLSLATELSRAIAVEDPGPMHLSVLLIATALRTGPDNDFIAEAIERANSETNTAERARLLTAAGLGLYYGEQVPNDLDLVKEAVASAQGAGMKRLTVAAASMACIGGLRLERPLVGAELARPFLEDLKTLGQDSIMSNGLISMYTEAAIQSDLPPDEHLAAIRHAGSTLRGDFNKLGQALARLVQHHGETQLAVRALGACDATGRSGFSTRQRTVILELAKQTLDDREIEALLAAGAVSETTDLYREMWAVLEPLMS